MNGLVVAAAEAHSKVVLSKLPRLRRFQYPTSEEVVAILSINDAVEATHSSLVAHFVVGVSRNWYPTFSHVDNCTEESSPPR